MYQHEAGIKKATQLLQTPTLASQSETMTSSAACNSAVLIQGRLPCGRRPHVVPGDDPEVAHKRRLADSRCLLPSDFGKVWSCRGGELSAEAVLTSASLQGTVDGSIVPSTVFVRRQTDLYAAGKKTGKMKRVMGVQMRELLLRAFPNRNSGSESLSGAKTR